MAEVRFVAKITNIGGCSGVIIPKAVAQLLSKKHRYIFSVEEIDLT